MYIVSLTWFSSISSLSDFFDYRPKAIAAEGQDIDINYDLQSGYHLNSLVISTDWEIEGV